MQILLANAKIMTEAPGIEPLSDPMFQEQANVLALEMASLAPDELARQLDCNRKLALENWQRYQEFFSVPKIPAIMAYNGQAYKHLRAKSLDAEALAFAQRHLWITCFLYGLLRPMDGIVPYRMEHCVKLEATGMRPIHQYWKEKLTEVLISSVKADDGILVHLSTGEYEQLFDWQRVCRELRVIHPLFYVRTGEELKMQAVWAKSCRGAMVRFILKNRLSAPDELHAFSYEGFEYNPRLGEASFPHFVRE